MPKSVSASLEAHLAQEVTTLATCWRITRRDGVEFFFTDHDKDIEFEGATYSASLGYNRTAVQNASDFSADNLDVTGVLDDSSITEQELRAGAYDYAEVRLFLVNWADLSQGALRVRRGTLGEVILTPQGVFTTELRGLAQALSQQIGELYSPLCRADLGDARCKVPVDPPEVERNMAYAVGDYVKTRIDFSRMTFVNPAAETGDTTGWTSALGLLEVAQAPRVTPVQGTWSFAARASDEEVQAYQVVSVPSALETDIDLGLIDVKARIYALTQSGTEVSFVVTALDSSDTPLVLASNASAQYASWTELEIRVTLPATTRKIRFDFVSVRQDALSDNNGYFDALRVDLSATFDSTSYARFGQRIFVCTTAGVTENIDMVAYDSTLSAATQDGTAVFVTEEAWTRFGAVTSVTDRRMFAVSITDPAAVTGWYNGGVLTWETGQNAGRAAEIKDWNAGTNTVTMYLPLPYIPSVGDLFRLYTGCDKQLETCRDKFNNVLNFRGEPYVPGQDEFLRYPDAQ